MPTYPFNRVVNYVIPVTDSMENNMDPNEQDEIRYNNQVAADTAQYEAALENFMQVEWDGERLQSFSYEGMSDTVANAMATSFYQWYHKTQEFTDQCTILLFEDILLTIEEYTKE